MTDEMLQTRAFFEPSSVDTEARTAEVIWTTGARVQRSGFNGPYLEELSMAPESIRMDRLNNGAPLLNSHKYILDEGSGDIKTESFDVDDLLVKFTILDGDLKKVVKESQDPSSPQGVKLDHIEKKKIFESIKKIEDKILKIKIAIDKG